MGNATTSWFEGQLLYHWIRAMPDVAALLHAGARVADVGCGAGTALFRLAEIYPRSTFVGFDTDARKIARARIALPATVAGDRVRFEQRDCEAGLPERYDIVTAFDIINQAVESERLLTEIRRALQPDGRLVCLDSNIANDSEAEFDRLCAVVSAVAGFSHVRRVPIDGSPGALLEAIP